MLNKFDLIIFKDTGALGYEPEAALHSGEPLSRAATALWQQLRPFNLQALICYGQGAAPLATAICLEAWRCDQLSLSIIQLKSPKRYPDRDQQRGLACGPALQAGTDGVARVALIDDCVLSGSSVREALALLASQKLAVQPVAVAVYFDDRRPQGSRQMEASGLPVYSCVTRHALGLTRQALTDAPVLGRLLWRRHGFDFKRARSCAPVIARTKVLVGDDTCRLFGLDLATGNEAFVIEPGCTHPKGINNDLHILPGLLGDACDSVIYTTYGGEITRACAVTGQIRWRHKIDHALHSAPAWSATGDLFVNCESHSALNGGHGHLRALSAKSGLPLDGFAPYQHADFAPAQPACYHQRIFAAANDMSLVAVDEDSGALLWKTQTRGLVRGAVWAQRVGLGHCLVLVMTELGWAQCFDQETGRLLWERRLGAVSNHVAPILFNDLIWVSAGPHAFALSPITGKIAHAIRMRGALAWRPSISYSSNSLMFCSSDGNVAWVNAQGVKIREQKTLLRCYAPPALDAQHAVFLTLDGALSCYELSS